MITGVLFRERKIGRAERTKKQRKRRKEEDEASAMRRAGILFVLTSKATCRHPVPFSQGSLEISCMNIEARLCSMNIVSRIGAGL